MLENYLIVHKSILPDYYDAVLKAKHMIEEGKAMHHCVGGYTERWNSLILSARIDGKRVETIEVDLTDYHIEQSRGVCNKPTEFHDRIIGLMEENMNEIKKRNRKQRKAA